MGFTASLKQLWIGFWNPVTKEQWPGVQGWADRISVIQTEMENEPDMTPTEVIAWFSFVYGFHFSDGTAKLRGSDFTYEESQTLNVAMPAMLTILEQDRAIERGEV